MKTKRNQFIKQILTLSWAIAAVCVLTPSTIEASTQTQITQAKEFFKNPVFRRNYDTRYLGHSLSWKYRFLRDFKFGRILRSKYFSRSSLL